ncbi:MAG: nucleotidyltransferase [Polyangiaceae bacterium]|nr:nucleotidyltransferase [Polyangiaceae bacterium]
MKIHQDFRDLLAEFVDEKVEFMVIGGYAVAYYDRPRYTKDIDLWINPAPTNIDAASRALASFGAPLHIVNALRNAREDEIVWLGTPPLRIDFLRAVAGMHFEEAWQRREMVRWDDIDVPVIGIDDLLASKRAAGRPQDLVDVANLERVKMRR